MGIRAIEFPELMQHACRLFPPPVPTELQGCGKVVDCLPVALQFGVGAPAQLVVCPEVRPQLHGLGVIIHSPIGLTDLLVKLASVKKKKGFSGSSAAQAVKQSSACSVCFDLL